MVFSMTFIGDEYPAIVELAPYQRIPKKKLDKDPNWGKIHENPVFLEFKRNFEQKTIDTALKTTQHFFESVEGKLLDLYLLIRNILDYEKNLIFFQIRLKNKT